MNICCERYCIQIFFLRNCIQIYYYSRKTLKTSPVNITLLVGHCNMKKLSIESQIFRILSTRLLQKKNENGQLVINLLPFTHSFYS